MAMAAVPEDSVPTVLADQTDPADQADQADQRDPRDHPAHPDHQDHPDLTDPIVQDLRDHSAQPDHPDHLDPHVRAHQDLPDHPAHVHHTSQMIPDTRTRTPRATCRQLTRPKVPAITINTERPVKGITKVPTGNIIKPKTPAPTPAPTPYKPIPTQPPHFVNTYNPKPIVPIEPIRPTISVPAYKPSTPRPFEPAPTNRPTARPPIYNEPKTTPIVNKNVTPHPSPPFHVPSYPPSSETCVCNADKPHSSKPTYTSSSSYPNSNPASVDFNKQFTGFNGNPNFGSIMNAMSLTQLPVVPQAPGLPAFYPPDKIPKGAVIAFMPVVILPQEYYANCDDNAIRTPSKYQTVDPFPLGVQPATIPNSFSVHSIFSGAGPKDQCMCPCSCTQNLDKYHKKRETNAADAPEVTATVEEPAKAVEPIAEASSPVEVKAEAPVAAAATPVEAKVEAPVAEASSDVEVKVKAPVAEASTPAEVKVEAPIAEASTPVEVKVEAPVAEATTPVEVKVEAPVAAAEKSIATATITKVEPVAESATN
ncbi:adhesive plaque matrix protein-like isoform X2 [Drosophila hydei]|uniref:Adhesive plaque matrix protein-like isoform X2 n=1 Tax=Drosophila hydei TaxID=7224 RepID=A0A6J1L4R7_DROHY|nr:adhesive plaque matrix protein-like isoform X2 [Drosophila hydei]